VVLAFSWPTPSKLDGKTRMLSVGFLVTEGIVLLVFVSVNLFIELPRRTVDKMM